MRPVYLFSQIPKCLLLICAGFSNIVNGLMFDSYPSTVEVGKTYEVRYSPGGNSVTMHQPDLSFVFKLISPGDPNSLGTVGTLTTSATGGIFRWTVDSSLPNGEDYALEIRQGNSDLNFSGLIKVTGSNDSPSSSAAISSLPPSSNPPSTRPSSPQNSASTSPETPTSTSAPIPSSLSPASAGTKSAQATATSATSAITSEKYAGSTSTKKGESSTFALETVATTTTSTRFSATGSTTQSLPIGTKIGIGIGAAIGGLILALAAFFLRASFRRKASGPRNQESGDIVGMPEIDGKEMKIGDDRPEIDGSETQAPILLGRAEMNGAPDRALVRPELVDTLPQRLSSTPAEMDGEAVRAEMDVQPSTSSPQELLVSVDTSEATVLSLENEQPEVKETKPFEDPRLTQNPWA
ncbi:uncharacterized protein BDR25DRAFT_341497 [Lindgomyces ingoldianus]|uniref:Uncharacterized protein n=1 Tax=Lindgomyces ingoldianus TaxID=673940 RepID=A0ACB6R3N0_9PLEO|nr:uncharacterized protein BDR25DRAFT_341497 [Lindgomyces ingoldianus]KAF2473438.1 hypothetical protein BDR25DRAFT_341497 [Lindgomyces ingoldianus]